jgi:hypothetical protein
MAGYGKNLYEGMDRRPSLALGALFFLFVGAGLPWGLLVGALWAPTIVLAGRGLPWAWTAWIALVCALPIVFRWAVERADGRSGIWAWTHPLGNVVLAAVLMRAIARTRTTWKGRAFDDGKAAA